MLTIILSLKAVITDRCRRRGLIYFSPCVVIILFIFLIFSHSRVSAQSDSAAILERQRQLIENQQFQQLREDQERALQAMPEVKGADLNKLVPQIVVTREAGLCRDIREIEITGDAQLIADDSFANIKRDYVSRCLSVNDIEIILALLTKYFIERGFVTTRAYLPAQDLRSGKLEIIIVAGRIDSYQTEGGRKGAIQPYTVFPGRPGDVLNLRDLEQGIDQINSLSSNNARLNLLPGSLPGSSIVTVQNRSSFPVHLYSAYDNLSADTTGRNSVSVTVSADSLLGLNELFSVTRRHSVFPFVSEHQSASTGILARFPSGYNTLWINYNRSDYRNMLSLPSGTKLNATGSNDSWSVGLDRVLFRNHSTRAGLSVKLASQESNNWLAGEFLPVSSRRLTFFDAGGNVFSQLWGGVFNSQISVTRGLPLFGGLHDANNLSGDLPHAQFTRFTLNAGYSHRFTFRDTDLVFSTQFSGQYSLNTLYGSQQILIGGSSSVRGFLNTSLAGDNGYFIRNELSLPWRRTAGSVGDIAGRVYTGVDWGRVSNRASGVSSGSLSGITLGMELQWHPISLNTFVSHRLSVPSVRFDEGVLFGLRISVSV